MAKKVHLPLSDRVLEAIERQIEDPTMYYIDRVNRSVEEVRDRFEAAERVLAAWKEDQRVTLEGFFLLRWAAGRDENIRAKDVQKAFRRYAAAKENEPVREIIEREAELMQAVSHEQTLLRQAEEAEKKAKEDHKQASRRIVEAREALNAYRKAVVNGEEPALNNPPAKIRKIVDQWSNQILGEEELTEKMRSACANVIARRLSGEMEYTLEKFTKSFCEPIVRLYKLLAIKEGIDPKSLSRPSARRVRSADALKQKQERVRRQVRGEIKRQQRHYLQFMFRMAS